MTKWTKFTPTLLGGGKAPTAQWRKIGKTVEIRFGPIKITKPKKRKRK